MFISHPTNSGWHLDQYIAYRLLFQRLLLCQMEPLLLLCRELGAVTIEVERGFLELFEML